MHFYLLILFSFFSWFVNGQSPQSAREPAPTKTMTVEIWSDVMCPFCYIGKRKFEAALAQFSGKDSVRVIWRSYQLDPDLQTDTTKSVAQSLSEKKGWSAQQTSEMIDYVRDMAKTVQLDYHFDKAVVANSFDAHRFSHYALKHGKQIEAEEKLFSAYFTEGKNIADHQTLAEIGASIGLDAKDILQSLSTDANKNEVNDDLALARQFGITGVPFFVFNRKMAVSGAQDVQVFLQTLQKSASEQ